MSETDLFRNGNCTYDFSGVLIKYGDMVFNKKIIMSKGLPTPSLEHNWLYWSILTYLHLFKILCSINK